MHCCACECRVPSQALNVTLGELPQNRLRPCRSAFALPPYRQLLAAKVMHPCLSIVAGVRVRSVHKPTQSRRRAHHYEPALVLDRALVAGPNTPAHACARVTERPDASYKHPFIPCECIQPQVQVQVWGAPL